MGDGKTMKDERDRERDSTNRGEKQKSQQPGGRSSVIE